MIEARSGDEEALRTRPFHEVSGSQDGSLLHVSYSGCLNTGSHIAEQDSSSTVLLERLIVFQKPAPLTLYGRPKIAGSAYYHFHFAFTTPIHRWTLHLLSLYAPAILSGSLLYKTLVAWNGEPWTA